MKRFGTKQLIPLCTAAMGALFAYVGFFQLGFWDKEPKPGFFPTIIAAVLILSSIAAFFQTLKEEGQPEYNKDEISVIIGALILITGSVVVGLIPMVFIYLFGWLKIVEKSPLKDILIIMAVMAAIVIGVFVLWLQVQFPWGVFEAFM